MDRSNRPMDPASARRWLSAHGVTDAGLLDYFERTFGGREFPQKKEGRIDAAIRAANRGRLVMMPCRGGGSNLASRKTWEIAYLANTGRKIKEKQPAPACE